MNMFGAFCLCLHHILMTAAVQFLDVRKRKHEKIARMEGRDYESSCFIPFKMNYLAFLCCFLLFFCPCCLTKTREKLIFKDGERRVFVLDEIFPSQAVNSFYKLVSFGKVAGKISSWFYTKSDSYQDFATLNATSNSPWMAAINPEFFIKTALWNITRNEIELISAGKVYFPYDVAFTMHRRLDFITVAGKGEKNLKNTLEKSNIDIK